jgi:hypothetical protein
MKIKIITLVFLGTLGSLLIESKSLLEYEEPMALCVGDIVFNTEIDPDLCLYYKGNKLQIDINYDKKSKRLGQVTTKKELVKIVPYTLNEAKATQQFHMLVCNHPQFASDNNTITYLHVPEDMPYKFYTLSAARKYDDNGEVIGCMWTVTEDFLSDDRIVPDNTIIFLFNAGYIEGLEAKSWPLNSNIRLLPSIVMKKTIEAEDVARAIIEARMIAIDFDTVHHHDIQNATKIENKTVVTVKP